MLHIPQINKTYGINQSITQKKKQKNSIGNSKKKLNLDKKKKKENYPQTPLLKKGGEMEKTMALQVVWGLFNNSGCLLILFFSHSDSFRFSFWGRRKEKEKREH